MSAAGPVSEPTQPEWSAVYEWQGPPRLRLDATALPGGRLQHRMVSQNGRPGVVVLAVAGDAVLFVQQHRPVVDALAWELPRGFGEAEDGAADSDDALVAAATRELREESGLELQGGSVLGRFWPDSGLLAGTVGAVVGSAVTAGGSDVCDRAITGTRWVPLDQLPALVRRGAIRDGLSLTALALWWARGA